MTYETLNGTLVSSDLSQLFIYANSVTDGYFGLLITIAFGLVVLIGSAFAQLRFSGRIRPDVSFLVSSFALLGWAILLEQYSGILNAIHFYMIVSILILSLIWVALSRD